MNISKTLIFENRAQYLKAIIIKIFLSLLVAKLFTYQDTFLGTVFSIILLSAYVLLFIEDC